MRITMLEKIKRSQTAHVLRLCEVNFGKASELKNVGPKTVIHLLTVDITNS